MSRWLVTAGILLGAVAAFAHATFESSTRVIARDHTMEFVLTVGMEGGATLLAGAPAEALQTRAVGPGCPLPVEFGERWFAVTAGGAVVKPVRVAARTDGLEFSLVAEYPRPGTEDLELKALYVDALPADIKSAFVLTDENGNIFASRLLKPAEGAFEVSLPPALTTAVPVEPVAVAATTSAAVPAQETPAVAPVGPKLAAGAVMSFVDFLKLGIEHILGGYDHLLFLCALLVACRRVKPMLAIITCFTLAHSVTLALAALDLVRLHPRIVEPLIAASIVFVGVENFRGHVDTRTRCGVTLLFGLVHGFGFAGALRETGLVGTGVALVKPLLGFNLGVECGQLAVAAVFLPVLFALRRVELVERHGTVAISCVVVLMGGFWLVQRVLGF